MTPTTTPATHKADVQIRVNDAQRSNDSRNEPRRREPVKAWIRPAPGDDKYEDVPCTD